MIATSALYEEWKDLPPLVLTWAHKRFHSWFENSPLNRRRTFNKLYATFPDAFCCRADDIPLTNGVTWWRHDVFEIRATNGHAVYVAVETDGFATLFLKVTI